MERYDRLHRLYGESDTEIRRDYQRFVDVLSPTSSRVALEHRDEASRELETHGIAIREAFPTTGETFADVAARANREQAFTALDSSPGRSRRERPRAGRRRDGSAGNTDNEIHEALGHELDLPGETVAAELDLDATDRGVWTRRYYAERPETRGVLEATRRLAGGDADLPEAVREVLERVDVAYYVADAGEMGRAISPMGRTRRGPGLCLRDDSGSARPR